METETSSKIGFADGDADLHKNCESVKQWWGVSNNPRSGWHPAI